MDIPHIKSAATKIQKAYAAAEAAKIAQKEIGLLFDDETARRRELGRALSQQADKAKKLLAAARIDLGLAEDELHEKWAEGERAMRGEGEFRVKDDSPRFKPGERVRFDIPATRSRPARFGVGSVTAYVDYSVDVVTKDGSLKTVSDAIWVKPDGGLDTPMHKSTLVRIADEKPSRPRARGSLRLVEEEMSSIEDEVRSITPGARASVQKAMRELGSQDINLDTPPLSTAERRMNTIRSTMDAIGEKRDLEVSYPQKGVVVFTSPRFQKLRVALRGIDGVRITQLGDGGGRDWEQEQLGGPKATVRFIRERVEESLDWLFKRKPEVRTPKGVKLSSSGQWDWRKDEAPPVFVGLPVTVSIGNSQSSGVISDVNKTRSRITVQSNRDGSTKRWSWRKGRQRYVPVGQKPGSYFLRLGVSKDASMLD